MNTKETCATLQKRKRGDNYFKRATALSESTRSCDAVSKYVREYEAAVGVESYILNQI